MQSSECASDIYNTVYDSLLAMPARLVLARSTYGVDFGRHIVANNVSEYRSLNGSESFKTILIGEILPAECGTRFSAKGNHYLGSMFNVHAAYWPSLIDDKTRVKNVLVLGKPCDSTKDFANLWDNQLVTLCDVIQQDKCEQASNNIQIKEWTAHAGSDNRGDPDYIVVVTEPMYTTTGSTWKTSQPGICKKKKILGERSSPLKAFSSKTLDAYDGDDMEISFGDECETELTECIPDADNIGKKGDLPTISA
ncbi:hypothetical protein J3R83DRAFT_1332 [Lanmaoa asiatica]|nr:hypothetical protein J3R83DRAFT_1332 [Lanmaoa asiatica]